MDNEELILRFDRSVRSWYNDVGFELHLLHGYIKNVERLILESISIYHNEQETHIKEYDEGYASIITVHQGIDDSTYHLDTIFEGYFPDIQRSSALITLYSFFEHQLDELCRRFAEERNFSISLTDLKENGINRSSLYLRKVASLPLSNSTVTWQEIKNIQRIRNAIVHNDTKLKDPAAIEYVRSNKFLSEEVVVRIKEGYLPQVIEAFDNYFKEVNELIIKTGIA